MALLVLPNGGATFTYSWAGNGTLSSPTSSSPTFSPTVPGLYTFTVTVTNEYGCVCTCSIDICVKDIRVPGHQDKVYLCHVPPDNPQNPLTLALSVNAVAAHLPSPTSTGHPGDRLGTCTQNCGHPKRSADESGPVPAEYTLEQNFPNPFGIGSGHTITIVTYGIPEQSTVMLRVYDVHGRIVSELASGKKDAGTYTVEFDATNLPSGIYLYRLDAGEMHITKTMTVVQ